MVAMLGGLDWRISDDVLKIEVTANTLYSADFCFVVRLRTSYFAVGMENKKSAESPFTQSKSSTYSRSFHMCIFLGDREDACLSRHPCRFCRNIGIGKCLIELMTLRVHQFILSTACSKVGN
jgi:hypothetical protein